LSKVSVSSQLKYRSYSKRDFEMSETDKLLELTHRLLEAISKHDWKTYEELNDPTLTAFEPEALGQLIEGLEFHRFYFELEGSGGASNWTITNPRVRVIGEVAVVAYVRLIQIVEANVARTISFEETRIWQCNAEGKWRQIHMHRSAPPNFGGTC
jgi:hypothetical protein